MSDTPVCFDVFPELDKQDMEALRAVADGEADGYQQKLALAVIVNKFCRTHDVSFVPGAADQSTFLAGRAFVGSRILLALNRKVGHMEKPEK